MPDKERSMEAPLTERIAQLRPRLTWIERMPKRWPPKDMTNVG